MSKRICCTTVGLGIVLASTKVFAAYTVLGTGTLEITAPGFPPDQAGPYQVEIKSVTSGWGPASGSFQTFCLGTQVDYFPGSTYNYQISDTIQPVNGPGIGASHDFVTWGTAWLYHEFNLGKIGGGTANNIANDALQAAIWTLQGQTFSGSVNLTWSAGSGPGSAQFKTDLHNDLVQVSNAAVSFHTTVGAEADGAFSVYAMNLYTGSASDPTYFQPQLVIVPETTTLISGALMLLPLGAGAFRWLRKRSVSA